MKKTLISIPVLCLCFSIVPWARAAEVVPPGPPKVLQIFREEVKPGKGVAHEKLEEGWPAAFRKANFPGFYLAMTTVTGPNEAWFVGAWDSFEEVEKSQAFVDGKPALKAELDRLGAQENEMLSRSSGILARYRPELSYRPDFETAKMRFFDVMTYRSQPGHEGDVTSLVKLIIDAHTKANVDEHWASYEVVSGAPLGTYLVFTPMHSLAELDTDATRHGKPFQDALGEDGAKKLDSLSAAATKASENALFAFSPKMSYVSQKFAAKDPEFWTPKPAAAAPAKKEPPKPKP